MKNTRKQLSCTSINNVRAYHRAGNTAVSLSSSDCWPPRRPTEVGVAQLNTDPLFFAHNHRGNDVPFSMPLTLISCWLDDRPPSQCRDRKWKPTLDVIILMASLTTKNHRVWLKSWCRSIFYLSLECLTSCLLSCQSGVCVCVCVCVWPFGLHGSRPIIGSNIGSIVDMSGDSPFIARRVNRVPSIEPILCIWYRHWNLSNATNKLTVAIPFKHKTLNQCCFNVGLASRIVIQH